MTDESQDFEARLARLTEATESVEPRSSFEDRVMAAVAADGALTSSAPDWLSGVARGSPLALGIAAMVAAVAVVVALQSPRSKDATEAVAYDTIEVSW